MGGSYEHLMVIDQGQTTVAEALDGWRALVVEVKGTTVVFHDGDMDVTKAALRLSASVPGDVVGFAVFDDEVIRGVLCRSGAIVADVTAPALEDYVEQYTSPATGAVPFVAAVDRGDHQQALDTLSDSYREGEYVPATERHHFLLLALDLPEIAAGWDYFGLAGGGNGYNGPAPTHVGG